MNKILLASISTLLILLFSSSYILQSNGMPGYTGSPGEQTCNACHGGGSSSASGITITTVPSFTNNEYMPDSTYHVTIGVSASGFGRYGFACEILDSLLVNAGIMLNNGAGVKFQNAFNGRRNAVHTTPQIAPTASFNFDWTAPSIGRATFFVAANAVNGNNNTSGDFPVTRISLSLTPAPPTPSVPPVPEDSTKDVGLDERSIANTINAYIYPNPASGFTNLNYTLSKSEIVTVTLMSIDGKEIKHLSDGRKNSGYNSQILDLNDMAPGVYLVRINTGGRTVSQKMVAIN